MDKKLWKAMIGKNAKWKEKVQDALAAFIAATAAVIGRTYWLTIQGNCELGLCLTTMLTVEEYSAVLFCSELVDVKNKKNGGFSVTTSVESKWKPFLGRYNLDGKDAGTDCITEITKSR